MKNNNTYDFYGSGLEFGNKISNCSEQSIIYFLGERTRMYYAHFGIKAAAEFKKGAISAINGAQKVNDTVNQTVKKVKTR